MAADHSPTVSWTGRYFEDFTVGDVYRHALGRTILATDNAWLTLLTQNTAPLHFDRRYAAQTEFGKPLIAIARPDHRDRLRHEAHEAGLLP